MIHGRPKAPRALLPVLLRATLLWAAICALAIGNGGVREAILEPALGPTPGLLISGLLLALLVLAVACLGAPWYGRQPAAVLIGVGVYWLVLTVAFEVGLGLFVLGRSGNELLAQYSPDDGNLWLLVLATLVVAPWLAGRFRRLV